jgi:hypothetical protein
VIASTAATKPKAKFKSYSQNAISEEDEPLLVTDWGAICVVMKYRNK